MNEVTMKLQADELIRMALQEDITSEDVSTNAVMPTAVKGTVDLIANFVSSGALTHSAPILDISMKHLHAL